MSGGPHPRRGVAGFRPRSDRNSDANRGTGTSRWIYTHAHAYSPVHTGAYPNTQPHAAARVHTHTHTYTYTRARDPEDRLPFRP